MKLPSDTKVGDMLWFNNEPVRIVAWYYSHGTYYFDLEFIDIIRDGKPSAGMTWIPVDFEFYKCDIRKMSSLELELF